MGIAQIDRPKNQPWERAGGTYCTNCHRPVWLRWSYAYCDKCRMLWYIWGGHQHQRARVRRFIWSV